MFEAIFARNRKMFALSLASVHENGACRKLHAHYLLALQRNQSVFDARKARLQALVALAARHLLAVHPVGAHVLGEHAEAIDDREVAPPTRVNLKARYSLVVSGREQSSCVSCRDGYRGSIMQVGCCSRLENRCKA